jgi:SAM-dependent methyltransferase
MTKQPHSSWAEVYDIAYQRSFGDFYDQLTDATVELIAGMFAPPASIVDFGAGTGRLFLPLSKLGYAVTAVEPCREMLAQLQGKDQRNLVRSVCSRMEEFRGEGKFDMALCVFTVILYLLDEDSLKKSLAAAYEALRPDGMLLLDIPSEAIFSGYSRRDPCFERTVAVTRHNRSIYTYREELVVTNDDGEATRYEDEFHIRHWSKQQVMELLKELGFVDGEDLTPHFSGAGSSYYKFKKPNRVPGVISSRIPHHPAYCSVQGGSERTWYNYFLITSNSRTWTSPPTFTWNLIVPVSARGGVSK